MKFVMSAVAMFFAAMLMARASIEVSIIGSDAQIVHVAEEAGESDMAQFTIVATLYAVDGDVYLPSDAVQMMTIDWGSASSQISGFTPFVTSMNGSSDGYFHIQEGSSQHFWMSVFAIANEDTVARLQITGLNWTDQVGGDLVTSVQAPPLETAQLFINTEIVPEPGAIVLMTIGGGILSIIAMHRRRSAQKC